MEPFGGAVNPGAMAFLGNEWQLGLAWFSPDRNASRSGSGQAGMDGYVDSGSKNFFIPEFGVNWKYSPDIALRHHRLRQRRDEHRLSRRPDPEPERLHGVPRRTSPRARTTCSAATTTWAST